MQRWRLLNPNRVLVVVALSWLYRDLLRKESEEPKNRKVDTHVELRFRLVPCPAYTSRKRHTDSSFEGSEESVDIPLVLVKEWSELAAVDVCGALRSVSLILFYLYPHLMPGPCCSVELRRVARGVLVLTSD